VPNVVWHPADAADDDDLVWSLPVWDGRASRRVSLVIKIALLACIVGVAGYLRLHDLDSVPPGLHGDEAISGLEGRRILREGWIGPYSPHALGQPTGPLYLIALSVRLFGDSIFAVRLAPALLGTLTVIALYVVLRRNVDVPTALVGAGLLALMSWHLHYSRIGFPVAAWPLVVVLAAGAVAEAARRDSRAWWAVSGALTGLGIYAYNAHPVVMAVIVAFVVVWLIKPSALCEVADGARGRLGNLAVFGAGLGLTLLPMVFFAADERNGYFQHYRRYASFNQPEWIAAAVSERVSILAGRYLRAWDQLCCHPVLDGVDASGLTPLVPLSLLILSVIGVGLALWQRREPFVVLGVLVIVFAPVAAVLTVEGLARRTIVLAPFLAAFAGFGIVTLWRAAWRRGFWPGIAAAVALGLLTGLTVYRNLDDQLRIFPRSQEAAWVFSREMTAAAQFMRDLPPGHHVYFFSERWPVNYEIRQFLAPDVSAEDRSREFGRFDLTADPAQGAPVFILLGAYQELLPEIERRYPGGETVRGRATGADFVAYVVDGVEKSRSSRSVGKSASSKSRQSPTTHHPITLSP
jgi:4-amino-4-deoxy-L-arabinose transferase-like glycosyltransferase